MCHFYNVFSLGKFFGVACLAQVLNGGFMAVSPGDLRDSQGQSWYKKRIPEVQS